MEIDRLLKRLDPSVQKQLCKLKTQVPNRGCGSTSKLNVSDRSIASNAIPKLQRATSFPTASSSSNFTPNSPLNRRTASLIPHSTATRPSRIPSYPITVQDDARDMVQALKAGKADAISKVILRLEETLRDWPCDFTCAEMLPPSIPPRIDLAPIFLEFLTSGADTQLDEILTSWEFTAGVLPHIVGPMQYIPIYISRSNRKATNVTEKTRKEMYRKGLCKLKLIHGSKDAQLPARLLELLTTYTHSNIDEEFVLAILQWINEIICEHIGLAEEIDSDLHETGKPWLVNKDDEIQSASRWFELSENVNFYLERLISLSNAIIPFPALVKHISVIFERLRLANEHVYESVSLAHSDILDKLLSLQTVEHDEESQHQHQHQRQDVEKQEEEEKPEKQLVNGQDRQEDFSNSVCSIQLVENPGPPENLPPVSHLAMDIAKGIEEETVAEEVMPLDTFAHENIEVSEMIQDIDEPIFDLDSSPYMNEGNKVAGINLDKL